MNRRLQEIKRKVMTFNQELREIDLEEHVDWLIEQAERVQRLEELVEGYKIELMIKDNGKTARQALGWEEIE